MNKLLLIAATLLALTSVANACDGCDKLGSEKYGKLNVETNTQRFMCSTDKGATNLAIVNLELKPRTDETLRFDALNLDRKLVATSLALKSEGRTGKDFKMLSGNGRNYAKFQGFMKKTGDVVIGEFQINPSETFVDQTGTYTETRIVQKTGLANITKQQQCMQVRTN
jgi:hypothetical protein